MPVTRTLAAVPVIALALAAALCLGAAGTPASASSAPCATASLTASRAAVLASLTREKTTDSTQLTQATATLATEKAQLAQAGHGSAHAHALAGKITVVDAQISALHTDLSSVNADVASLALCSSARVATVKTHVTWRKLVTQRAVVTAELSVARSDLSWRLAQYKAEKKARNVGAERTTKRLIADDRSQISVDKSELAGIARALKKV